MKSKIGTIGVIFIALLLAIIILVGLFHVVPYIQKHNQELRDTFSFISIDGGIKILGYKGNLLYNNSGDLVIPKRINGQKVIEIGENAFAGNGYIKSVKIPSTVKTIGDQAFYNCSVLSEVEFGKNVEDIGECAFYGCVRLKEIELPKKMRTIESGTFSFSGLEKITIPENIKLIEQNVFAYCYSLTWVEFENDSDWQVVYNNRSLNVMVTNEVLNANSLVSTNCNYMWIYVG